MKNIQIIDAALNCTYDVFAASEEDFRLIFPGPGQDIEFIDDFIERAGEDVADEVCGRLWKNRVEKQDVAGIHGTLFFELDHKKKFYPTKKASEMVAALD